MRIPSVTLPDRINPLAFRLDRLDDLERRRQEIFRTVAHARRVLERYREDRRLESLHALRYREGAIRVRQKEGAC